MDTVACTSSALQSVLFVPLRAVQYDPAHQNDQRMTCVALCAGNVPWNDDPRVQQTDKTNTAMTRTDCAMVATVVQ